MSVTGDHPMDDVLAMARGHWVSLVLRAAVELGVLESLLTPTTLPDLAVATGSDRARCDGSCASWTTWSWSRRGRRAASSSRRVGGC